MPPSGESRPELGITPAFLSDLTHWSTTDTRMLRRIVQLLESIQRDPFTGIGKPEPLKHLGSGHWSRRITQEHRLTYRVEHGRITLLRARTHYER